MRRTQALAVPVLLVIGFGAAPALYGFFGITVYDPTNWLENTRQLLQLQQQYQQLVQTYQQVTNQYNHMVRMARIVPVNMRSRYRARLTPWKRSTATDSYGTTGGWIGAVNSGAGVATGYMRAVEELIAYGTALSRIPANQHDRLKRHYATVELTDGANLHSIETIGLLRGNAPRVEAAIQGLEDDSLSPDPEMNTEIAVLNKINAAAIVSLRNGQDTNKLLVSLLEQQAVEAKRKRDADAAAIATRVEHATRARTLQEQHYGTINATLAGFRLP